MSAPLVQITLALVLYKKIREIHIGILALTKIHSNKRDSAFSKPVNNYDLNILFQYNAQWVVLTKIFTKNSIFFLSFSSIA